MAIRCLLFTQEGKAPPQARREPASSGRSQAGAWPRHQGEPRGALHPPLPRMAWGKSCLARSGGAAGARRDRADRKRVAGTRDRVRAALLRNNPGSAAACLALLSGSRRQGPGWPAPHCHHSPRWAIWDSRSCCCSGHTLAEFWLICSLSPFLPPLTTVSHSSQLPPPLSPTRCYSHPICCDPCSRAAVASAPAVPPLTQLWSAGPAAGPPPAASPSQCRLLAAAPCCQPAFCCRACRTSPCNTCC